MTDSFGTFLRRMRENNTCPVCGIERRDTCHARYEACIAELEAELERVKDGWSQCTEHAQNAEAELRTAQAEIERLKCALSEIAEACGAFTRDPLTHARNTVESMVDTANAALEQSGGRRTMTGDLCAVCGKGTRELHAPDANTEPLAYRLVSHLDCVQREHKRAEKAERALSRALNMLVTHGFDAEEHGGKLIVHQNIRALTIPAGAKERIRAVLEADDE